MSRFGWLRCEKLLKDGNKYFICINKYKMFRFSRKSFLYDSKYRVFKFKRRELAVRPKLPLFSYMLHNEDCSKERGRLIFKEDLEGNDMI